MKRFFTFLAVAAMSLAMGSCTPEMEEFFKELEEQIETADKLLNAKENGLTINNVVEDEEGYTITLSDGSVVTIKHDTVEGGINDLFVTNVEVGEEGLILTFTDGTVVVIPYTNQTEEEAEA